MPVRVSRVFSLSPEPTRAALHSHTHQHSAHSISRPAIDQLWLGINLAPDLTIMMLQRVTASVRLFVWAATCLILFLAPLATADCTSATPQVCNADAASTTVVNNNFIGAGIGHSISNDAETAASSAIIAGYDHHLSTYYSTIVAGSSNSISLSPGSVIAAGGLNSLEGGPDAIQCTYVESSPGFRTTFGVR